MFYYHLFFILLCFIVRVGSLLYQDSLSVLVTYVCFWYHLVCKLFVFQLLFKQAYLYLKCFYRFLWVLPVHYLDKWYFCISSRFIQHSSWNCLISIEKTSISIPIRYSIFWNTQGRIFHNESIICDEMFDMFYNTCMRRL